MKTENNYYVYYHVTPDNMYYIGMSKQPTKLRWRPSRYKGTSLYPYIEKYGWNNIKHRVIQDGLDRKEAQRIEDMLIEQCREWGCCINKKGSGGLIEGCDRTLYNEAHKEELLAKKKTYYKEHKEEVAEYQKAYREAHREETAEYQKAYRESNKEELLAKKKTYYKEHKEQIATRKKAYREAHREKLAEYQKSYREAHKEELAAKRKEQRLKKKQESNNK